MEIEFRPGEKAVDITTYRFSKAEVKQALRNLIHTKGDPIPAGKMIITYPDVSHCGSSRDVFLRIEHDA